MDEDYAAKNVVLKHPLARRLNFQGNKPIQLEPSINHKVDKFLRKQKLEGVIGEEVVDKFYDDYSNPKPGVEEASRREPKLKRRRSHLGCEHLWGLSEQCRHLQEPECDP